MTTSGIYKIRNKKTGHCYIGSSVDMPARKWNHFSRLRKGTHHSPHLQSSWNKYGEDAFEFIMLEEVPDVTKLIEREQYWIDAEHPKYNNRVKAESNLGMKHSEVTKAKLRTINLGKKESPEATQAKRDRQTGVPRTPATIERIKVARAKQVTTEGMLQGLAIGWALPTEQRGSRRGQKNSVEQNRKIAKKATDRKHTPATLEKMRLAKLGKKQSVELVERRIQASWGSKTEEEKAAIIAKRQATIAAKRNQLPEIS